jgi:LysM repeat protein
VKVSSGHDLKGRAVAVTGMLFLSGCGLWGNKSEPNSTLPPLPSNTLPPVTTLPPPTTTTVPTEYIVQKGDTLSRIAQQFGVTVAQLVAANNIQDPDHIEEGQRLAIPLPTAATSAPNPGTTAAPTTAPS